MTTPDPLAGELAAIRERASQITDEHGPGDCDLNGGPCTGHDAERLAAAVEAVLDLAGEWLRKSEDLDAAGEYLATRVDPDSRGAALKHARAIAYDECSRLLEQAIAAKLLGEGKPGGT